MAPIEALNPKWVEAQLNLAQIEKTIAPFLERPDVEIPTTAGRWRQGEDPYLLKETTDTHSNTVVPVQHS